MKYLLFILMTLSLCSCASFRPHTQVAVNDAPVATTLAPAASVAAVAPSPVSQSDAAPPVSEPPSVPYTAADVDCMATAMYYEARGEGETGQIAVGYVITNRVDDHQVNPQHFAGSICGVVYQAKRKNGRILLHRCQFGWYCDGKSEVIKNAAAFARAKELAKLVLLKIAPNPIGNKKYFEVNSRHRARRRYASRMVLGHHLFYDLLARR